MNETAATVQEQEPVDLVDADEADDTATKGPIADVDVVLNDLEQMADDFFAHVQRIRMLQENGFFKFASKNSRNEMMSAMVDQSRDLEELSKVAFRSLKKVKRERVPEEVVDNLLISSVTPAMLRTR